VSHNISIMGVSYTFFLICEEYKYGGLDNFCFHFICYMVITITYIQILSILKSHKLVFEVPMTVTMKASHNVVLFILIFQIILSVNVHAHAHTHTHTHIQKHA
jgi:hypothetical protein